MFFPVHLLVFLYTWNDDTEAAGETNENLWYHNLEISNNQNKESGDLTSGSRPVPGGEKYDFNLPQFSFSSISAATNNFSPENKLGEGGFGPVYKVMSTIVINAITSRADHVFKSIS